MQQDIRCRVLLTSPLESFTIGHTIVVSRGLLDVLPDEASLAMVLAHELSHIVLGHSLDTKLAFNDRMFFPDEESFQRLDFKRRSADEDAADTKALELLKNSPYKDKLGSAGLFLKALQASAPELPNLIRPHLGNSMAGNKSVRMSALLASAPELDPQRTDQISALPLGGRIKLDPWTDRVELAKAKPVALASAREEDALRDHAVLPLPHPVSNPGERQGGADRTGLEVSSRVHWRSRLGSRGKKTWDYWMELPTLENTLLAFEPIKRIVPTTITRITASMTAYSAMSCPLSSVPSFCQMFLRTFATGSVSLKSFSYLSLP